MNRLYISIPERRDVEGHPVLILPVGQKGHATMFGIGKCRAIIRYFKEIESFVEDCENQRIGGKHAKRLGQEEHSG